MNDDVRAIDRRTFMARTAGLGLALPLAGFAVRSGVDAEEATPTPTGPGVGSGGVQEGTGAATPAPQPPAPFVRFDPVLPSIQAGPKQVAFVAKDTTVFIAPEIAYAGWSLNGTIPGTPIRLMAGDEVTVTVRNEAAMGHSVDTHAAQTPPNVNYPIVNPGEEFSWSFTPAYPGAFMYHCGTPPVLMHIGAGMYGAMIVDPPGGWPPAQELVFVQSEFYVKDGGSGVMVPDFAKMMQYGALDFMAFNGHANQYVAEPIQVRVGEPIRIFLVNGGPNAWSSFHVVGAIFDAVYVNANPANKLVGLQSHSVGPGDGACFELTLREPGTYAAVNHAFGHAQHGAIALLSAS